MVAETLDLGAVPASWTRHHLLGLEDLSAEEITLILDTAVRFQSGRGRRPAEDPAPDRQDLRQPVLRELDADADQFRLAARRLGADTLDFSASTSSLSKGETFIDTAKNIEAMGVDVVVVRHRTPGTPHLLAQNLACAVINAGDGAHEHPTQGLLDIMTIRQRLGRIAGLTVALVGDIAHSRTARSNIWGLKKLGAHVIVCGPSTLVSPPLGRAGRRIFLQPRRDPAAGRRAELAADPVRAADDPAVPLGPRVRPFVCHEPPAAGKAKHDILILAPGPINRGVEVTPDVADGPQSAILEQVTNGVAVRMAVLWLLAGR